MKYGVIILSILLLLFITAILYIDKLPSAGDTSDVDIRYMVVENSLCSRVNCIARVKREDDDFGIDYPVSVVWVNLPVYRGMKVHRLCVIDIKNGKLSSCDHTASVIYND